MVKNHDGKIMSSLHLFPHNLLSNFKMFFATFLLVTPTECPGPSNLSRDDNNMLNMRQDNVDIITFVTFVYHSTQNNQYHPSH